MNLFIRIIYLTKFILMTEENTTEQLRKLYIASQTDFSEVLPMVLELLDKRKGIAVKLLNNNIPENQLLLENAFEMINKGITKSLGL